MRDDDVVLETSAGAVVHGAEHALPKGRRSVVHVGAGLPVHEPEPKPPVVVSCLR